ncbi:MAG: DUF4349 domain-containing protein [Firmicutes bacterium]|nr:DUF4349 domain-containing protein [Bacillota bacterium]
MKCEQVQQLIPDWLDCETEAFQAEAIKKHIDKCPSCRDEVSFWKEIGTTLRDEGNAIKAPPDFAAGVMARLPEQQNNAGRRVVAGWKRSAAAAAAFLLVAAGSAGAYLQWGGNAVTHVAHENPPAIVTDNPDISPSPAPDNSGGEDPGTETGATGSEKDTPKQSGASEKDPGVQNPVEKDTEVPTDDPSAGNVEIQSDPAQYVWLNIDMDRVIERTFLRVAVNDFDAGHEQVVQYLNNMGAQFEVLGSESTATGSQETVKVVVESSRTDSLLKNLKTLGQVVTDDQQRNDITSRYNENVEQYRSLEAQLAGTEDDTEREQLQVKMASIQAQLKAWDKEAHTDTIILWLES